MKFNYVLFAFAVFSISAQADYIFSMTQKQFYELDEYKEMYQTMQKSGQLEKSRESFKQNCVTGAKDAESKKKCECASNALDKVDDKAFMFDTVIMFKSFQAKVEANRQGNDAELIRLKKLDSDRKNSVKLAYEKCGVKQVIPLVWGGLK